MGWGTRAEDRPRFVSGLVLYIHQGTRASQRPHQTAPVRSVTRPGSPLVDKHHQEAGRMKIRAFRTHRFLYISPRDSYRDRRSYSSPRRITHVIDSHTSGVGGGRVDFGSWVGRMLAFRVRPEVDDRGDDVGGRDRSWCVGRGSDDEGLAPLLATALYWNSLVSPIPGNSEAGNSGVSRHVYQGIRFPTPPEALFPPRGQGHGCLPRDLSAWQCHF
jgi:hypothetical protein